MIEEFNGLSIERKIIEMFVEEEMDRVAVQLEGQRLQERDVVRENFLIDNIELVENDLVHVVVRQQKV